MRSAAARYGGEGDHDHHHHQQQQQQQQDHGGMMFHVPQHSRREKLRFPPDESPPLIHHDLDDSPTFYHPDALTTATFLPLSSPSSCCYYAPNPNPNPKFPTAAAAEIHDYRQPFSLSLSPSSSAHPPTARRHVSSDGVLPLVNPVPLGPFTGYAAVLNRSGFVEPARMLLEEMCHVVLGPAAAAAAAVAAPQPLSALRPAMDGPDRSVPSVEQQQRKMGLLSLLDEVCRRYRLYYQQVQAVITSFESVAGLSMAAPYASTALKVMQKHFKCLKSSISGQLRHMNKALQDELIGKGESSGFGLGNSDAYLPRTENSSVALRQSNVWRPQRGLPERAVSVLRAWLYEHFLHPYPTDSDKQMLAKHTGLSRNQVSNWFINARVRLWKPMVEEIHSLEMRELHKVAADGRDPIPGDRAQTSNSTLYNNFPQTIGQKNQSPPSKRIRENAVHIPRGVEEPLNFIFDDLSAHHHHVGVGGGVSLTLGLQNNGVNLVDPIPSNSIRGFGYEECNDDAYVVGAFGGPDRQFGKDVGGHFFHGFGG